MCVSVIFLFSFIYSTVVDLERRHMTVYIYGDKYISYV